MTITVSTDGSALGNPNGPMGWAWADHGSPTASSDEHQHPGDCDAGGATNGTNQIGELCAVLEALRAHPGNEPLIIETDSQYAINCSTTWVHGWKKNGWKNSQKKPVKNAALIKAIDTELSNRKGSVKFVWVKGHAGNAGNEKVDELARTYASGCRSKARDGYLPPEGWQSLLASEYAAGVDIPSDAQMLLDGSISNADYHLARGNDDAGFSPHDGETRVMPAAMAAVKPRNIADMLAEPEGYPADDLEENSEDGIDDDTIADTVTIDDAADNDAANIDNAESNDVTSNDDAEISTIPIEPEEATQLVKSGEQSESSEQSAEPAARSAQAAQPMASEHPETAAKPASKHSGLTVSGTLRFSPPPSSSPTYNGRPRLIRGYVQVEGHVDGDGTIVITDAPFAVRHM